VLFALAFAIASDAFVARSCSCNVFDVSGYATAAKTLGNNKGKQRDRHDNV